MKKYSKTISFLLGALSVLALPPFYVFPILLLSFGALLYFLNNAENKKRAFALGYWFGFGFFAFGLSWVGNALLIDAATFGWLYVITILASGTFFGIFIGIPALLASFHKNIIGKTLALAAWIVIFEWIRSWFLTGFPWNLWGSTLAFSSITLQLASIIGTYGLSLMVILFASSPALYFNGYKKTAIILPLILAVITLSFGFYRSNKLDNNELSEVKIRIVQPAIPQVMKWSKESLEDNFQTHIEMSENSDADLVIWGETASPFVLNMDYEHLNQITDAVPSNGYLLTGLVRYDVGEYNRYQPHNSAFIINKAGKIINHYDKSHLVPFGEYIPLRQYFPDWIRPITNTIADFKAGDGAKIISLPNIPDFSILICYEIIFPSQIIDRNNRPEFIINLTNDGWYGDSMGPRQHLVATKLRAVEEGVTIIRVANSGISAIISRSGQILESIPLNKKNVLDIRLPKNLYTVTIYGKFGNIIPLLLCIMSIITAFLFPRKNIIKI